MAWLVVFYWLDAAIAYAGDRASAKKRRGAGWFGAYFNFIKDSCLRLSGAGYRDKRHKSLRVTGTVHWCGLAGVWCRRAGSTVFERGSQCQCHIADRFAVGHRQAAVFGQHVAVLHRQGRQIGRRVQGFWGRVLDWQPRRGAAARSKGVAQAGLATLPQRNMATLRARLGGWQAGWLPVIFQGGPPSIRHKYKKSRFLYAFQITCKKIFHFHTRHSQSKPVHADPPAT